MYLYYHAVKTCADLLASLLVAVGAACRRAQRINSSAIAESVHSAHGSELGLRHIRFQCQCMFSTYSTVFLSCVYG